MSRERVVTDTSLPPLSTAAVFADPRGFGIRFDGKYHYENPDFTTGKARV